MLYDNAGVLGNKAVTGTGNVVLAEAPTLDNPIYTGTLSGPTLVASSSGVIVSSLNISGNKSIGTQFLHSSNSLIGVSNAVGNLTACYYLNVNDSANNYSGSALDIFRVVANIQSGAAGGVQAIEAVLQQTQTTNPGDYGNASQFVGITSTTSSSVIKGSTGIIVGNTLIGSFYDGSVTGFYAQTEAKTGGGGYYNVIGAQINSTLAAGTSAARRIGVAVSQAGNANANGAQGTYVDTAYLVGEQSYSGASNPFSWRNGFQIGTRISQFPISSTGTLFSVVPKTYGVASPVISTVDRGLDLREAVYTTAAWLSPNAAIDGSGNVFGASVTTAGTLTAQTASVGSVTVVEGGSYPNFTALTVNPPPSGVTAQISVATMGGESVKGFGLTGINFVSSVTGGDALTLGGAAGSPVYQLYSASFTASIPASSTTMTVSAVASGLIVQGQIITSGASAGTRVVQQLTGTPNGIGTYQVDLPQTVASGSFTSSSVDGSGRIAALYLFSAGTMSQAPANPIQLTGSATGSGAWVNVFSWVNAGFSFAPEVQNVVLNSSTVWVPSAVGWQFATTGDNNYTVGDVLTVSNDGGTKTQLTVAAVINSGTVSTTPGVVGPISYYTSPTDGTWQPGLTVSTVGSVTSIPLNQYHTAIGGAVPGTGASFWMAYQALTASVVTGGSGYLPAPTPPVYSGRSDWKQGKFVPVMTPAAAPLSLVGSSVAITGNVTAGVWQGTLIAPTYGGTGVNNGSSNLTLGGSVTFSGAYNTTLTVTGATSLTLPTSGTLAVVGSTVASWSGGTTGLTPNTATTGAVTLGGTLALANGGLGLVSGTSGGVLGFTAAGTLASSGVLANNQVMVGGGAGATPSTSSQLNLVSSVLSLGVVGSSQGVMVFSGSTSGSVQVTAQAIAGTLTTFTLPNTSGTPVITMPAPLTSSATTGAATWTGLTSGGVLYNSGTASVGSSALLTLNSPVLGGGAGAAPKTSSAILSNGTASLTLGLAATGTGVLGLAGTTSGTVSVTVGAAAGTYNFVLPATVGTAGQVLLSAAGSAMTWTTGALALAGNLTTTGAFNTTLAQVASGTYTLPSLVGSTLGLVPKITYASTGSSVGLTFQTNTKIAQIICVGAGGGGGGGGIAAALTAVSGGAGGGGGAVTQVIIPVAALGITGGTYTVGAAGTAGSGGAVPTAGGQGGSTSFAVTGFGTFWGGGGGGGAAGASATASGGGAGGGTNNNNQGASGSGATPGAGSVNGGSGAAGGQTANVASVGGGAGGAGCTANGITSGSGAATTTGGAGGGAAGGGITSAGVPGAGGTGSQSNGQPATAAGTALSTGGTGGLGGGGTTASAQAIGIGGGGGGASYFATGTQTGGAGGAGNNFGGGGGGGGAAGGAGTNLGGAGGIGAAGLFVCIEWA